MLAAVGSQCLSSSHQSQNMLISIKNAFRMTCYLVMNVEVIVIAMHGCNLIKIGLSVVEGVVV